MGSLLMRSPHLGPPLDGRGVSAKDSATMKKLAPLASVLVLVPLVAGCDLLKKGDKDKKDDGTSSTETRGGNATTTATPTAKAGSTAGCTLPEDEQIKGEVVIKKGCRLELKGNPQIVDNGVLKIEPGVTILMAQSSSLRVIEGKLVAKGTEKEPIVVTSANSTKAPGDWAAFHFGDKTNAGTELDYVKFEYGGSHDHGYKGAIDVQYQKSNGRISITNCTFSNNDQAAIFNHEPKGAFAKFTNNRMSKNKHSLDVHARVLGSVGAGNVFGDPLVTHGEIEESIAWPAIDAPVVVEDDVSISGERGAAVLTIQPKTVLKFADQKRLHIGGKGAAGLVAKEVTFTSANASPHPGDWMGIMMVKSAANVDLTGAVVEYAGEGRNGRAAIDVYGANAKDIRGLTVTGLVVKHSKGPAFASDDHDCGPFKAAKAEGGDFCTKQ